MMRTWIAVALSIALLAVASTSRAQIAPPPQVLIAPNAPPPNAPPPPVAAAAPPAVPAPALAVAAAPGLPQTDGTGRCTVDGRSEDSGRAACLDVMIRGTPTPIIQTPGAFFVGYAWGSKSHQVVYGPQVGVGGAVLLPVVRPKLECPACDPAATGDKALRVFQLPKNMAFTLDVAISLNVSLAAFTFPNAVSAAVTGMPAPPPTTQQTVNLGGYVAPQIGFSWWGDSTSQKRVALALGVLGGYINTDATGAAFTFGFQPALVAQF